MSAADRRRAVGTAREVARSGLEYARVGLARVRSGVHGALARPTASDVAAALVALVVTAAAGATLVGPRLAALATAAGAAAALVAVLLSSANPAVRAVGGVVAVPAAVLSATPSTLGWGFVLGVGGFGLVAATALWALVIVGLAAPLFSWSKLGDGGLRRGATGGRTGRGRRRRRRRGRDPPRRGRPGAGRDRRDRRRDGGE